MASRRSIDLLVAEGLGTVVIGKNLLWKQEVNLGRRTNQQFVCIPQARFIAMLTYKAELVGIRVIVSEESSTSQASFLDGDPLPVYGARDIPVFSGRRVTGSLYRAACIGQPVSGSLYRAACIGQPVSGSLYRAADGTPINADVNGAYNIIRKVAPAAFAQGSSGCVVHPVRFAA
jgi:putative transposase